jgi:hypothetical protein
MAAPLVAAGGGASAPARVAAAFDAPWRVKGVVGGTAAWFRLRSLGPGAGAGKPLVRF